MEKKAVWECLISVLSLFTCASSHVALCPTAGVVPEPVGQQDQGAEALSHALHLDEVVPEPASEWQALANVF